VRGLEVERPAHFLYRAKTGGRQSSIKSAPKEPKGTSPEATLRRAKKVLEN
jgi:hypothetical protein